MPRDAAKMRADAARMRSDMAKHKPAWGPLDVKLGEGGLVDLEFAVHTLQLTTGRGLDPRLEVAIAALGEAGLLEPAQVDADLRLLSRILVCLRLLAPGQVKLTAPTEELLARLCGQGDWDGLVAAMAAARQRISALWARVREDE
jgi:glutamate-ammonia-ligase adenylyltransferase